MDAELQVMATQEQLLGCYDGSRLGADHIVEEGLNECESAMATIQQGLSDDKTIQLLVEVKKMLHALILENQHIKRLVARIELAVCKGARVPHNEEFKSHGNKNGQTNGSNDDYAPNSTDGEDDDVLFGGLSHTPKDANATKSLEEMNSNDPTMISHIRVSKSKPRLGQHDDLVNLLGRKLFHTPSQGNRSPSSSRGEGSSKRLKCNARSNMSTPIAPTFGHTMLPHELIDVEHDLLPKEVLVKFKPTKAMKLTFVEGKVAAYVFGYDMDKTEILFKYGGRKLRRKELQTMIPGREIDPSILELMAYYNTWMQKHAPRINTWSLPSSFSEKICSTHQVEDILNQYIDEWMQPSGALSYIYVQMNELGVHWYLMVVSINEERVYLLDCYKDRDNASRKDSIKLVCVALNTLLKGKYSYTHLMDGKPNIQDWEICHAEWITNKGNSLNSRAYILEWIGMEYGFQPNLIDMVNEEVIRMRTVMKLLLGPMNNHKSMICERAENRWETLIHRPLM